MTLLAALRDEPTVLDDMADVVGEEIHDTNDEPMSGRMARYCAAALLVGMHNRGWEWSKPREVNVVVGVPSPFAATAEQVRAIIDSMEGGQP